MSWKARFQTGGIAFGMHWLVILLGIFIHFPKPASYLQLTHTPFDHLLQWDAQWYIAVAKYGYNIPLVAQHTFIPTGSQVPFPPLAPAGFFPLLPIIIHLFGAIGALIIGNAVYFVSLVLMSALFHDKLSRKTTLMAVVLYATNFTTIYQSALYAGAYTTLFSVVAIYGMRRSDRWGAFLACGAGFLASFTHEMGILLGVLAFHYLRRRQILMMLTYGISVLAGWGIFSVYLFLRFDKPFAMFSAQHQWHRTWAFPGYNWVSSLTHGRPLDASLMPILVLLLVLHIWYAFRTDTRITHPKEASILESQEVSLWMACILAIGMCAFVPGIPLMSVPRFLAVAWPMFGFLWFKNDSRRMAWMTGALALFLIFSVIGSGRFTHGIMFN